MLSKFAHEYADRGLMVAGVGIDGRIQASSGGGCAPHVLGRDSRDVAALEAWLARYEAAWESRDAELAASLFSVDTVCHAMPFETPRGRQASGNFHAGPQLLLTGTIQRVEAALPRGDVLLAGCGRGLQLLQHLIDAEGSRLLARREILE